MIKILVLFFSIGLLVSCSTISKPLKIQLMPRDEGVIYEGYSQGNGRGSGNINLNLKEKTCNGPYARGTSGESLGLIQTYGTNGKSSLGTVISSGGSITVKGILTCTDGTGIRCDFVGQNGTGTGICVDSSGKVFDAIVGN